MTQYKSIREWIAEGVDPIGYVAMNGMILVRVEMDVVASLATLESYDDHSRVQTKAALDYPVAPPAPKRLSDEELVDEYDSSHFCNVASDLPRLRSQILDRMKAKGPTRGEVEEALRPMLYEYTQASLGNEHKWAEARAAFLSMFPEGDQ